MALATEPEVVIMDEPTTPRLDVRWCSADKK